MVVFTVLVHYSNYLVIIHGSSGSLDRIKYSVVNHGVHREGNRVRG